jgi:hypothetical protein
MQSLAVWGLIDSRWAASFTDNPSITSASTLRWRGVNPAAATTPVQAIQQPLPNRVPRVASVARRRGEARDVPQSVTTGAQSGADGPQGGVDGAPAVALGAAAAPDGTPAAPAGTPGAIAGVPITVFGVP